jgi:carbonic anhydrase
MMTIIDRVVEANRVYAKKYSPTLGKRPEPKIAVVTCMDPRLSDLPGILGLPEADIDVIRTGGPAVTEDVLAELIVSNRVLATTEILLLNHTGCGFTRFTDDELNGRLSASTGDASPAPMRFFSFRDPEQHTLEQIEAVRSHPWIAKDVPVRKIHFRRGDRPAEGSAARCMAHRRPSACACQPSVSASGARIRPF